MTSKPKNAKSVSDKSSSGSGENSNWSYASSLPFDAWYCVLAFMSLDSIKNLSLCSKKYREFAAPIIFSHVSLNKDSRIAFEYGSLAKLRPQVRYIRISIREAASTYRGMILHPQSARGIRETYALSRRCIDSILLFGGLKGITLQFQEQALCIFKAIVVSEIIQRIARCPTHRKIQSITIDHFDKYIDCRTQWNDSSTCSLPEDQVEIEATLKERQYHLPNIKRLEFKCFGELDFSDFIQESIGKVHLKLLRSSAQTLRKLSIMAESISTGSEKDGKWPGYLNELTITFPVLESLSIIIHKWTCSDTLDVITKVFPNVKYLSLDSAGYAQVWGQEPEGQPSYPQLKQLKKLKRIRILRTPPSGDRAWNLLDRPRMEEKQGMAETIKEWVRGGLEDLEYVQFVRRKAGESPLEAFAREIVGRRDEDRMAFLITKGKNGAVNLECRMQFPDWYRPDHPNTFYLDLEDVLFEDKSICQYKESLEGET